MNINPLKILKTISCFEQAYPIILDNVSFTVIFFFLNTNIQHVTRVTLCTCISQSALC